MSDTAATDGGLPALEGRELTKSFGRTPVVDRVDIVVRRGTVHGLLGPNGAGKTTVLRILLGLVRPDSGGVYAAGTRLASAVPRGTVGIAGFVEMPGFYPYLTASRNLELLSAWNGRRASARVEDLLSQVGLGEHAQTKVRTFSAGMRQRLGLAAALISEPAVLVVDEPTTGLDPAGMRDLHELLTKLAAGGRSVLLSSHDLNEVNALCDDITVLRTGTVIHSGPLGAFRGRTSRRVYRLRTSDDGRAMARARRGDVPVTPEADALQVTGDVSTVDRFVLDLASDGIAVRELHQEDLPFDSLFFQLTEDETRLVEASGSARP